MMCRVGSDALLDLLFPPSLRVARVRAYTPDSIHADPRTHESAGMRITTLTRYHESAIEDLVRALKYEKSVHAASLFARLLADYLLDAASELSLFSHRELAIIPMPLAPQRERERGYNQIAFVLKQAPLRDTGITLRTDLLMRVIETPPQTRLSRDMRLKNVKGAFAVPDGADLSHLHIFLIDDVTTTGATLTEAARILKRNGANVTALAFAHA
jgi:ComF family protein